MNTVEQRAAMLGEYIIDGISKSTVHKDVTDRLRGANPSLYAAVREVLEKNKSERHIRGGEATREKYLHIRQRGMS